MLRLVEPKRWTIMDLSSARPSKPYLKFAARGYDVLQYDLGEYAVTPCPAAFATELLQQVEVGKYALVLAQSSPRTVSLGRVQRLGDVIQAERRSGRVFAIWK